MFNLFNSWLFWISLLYVDVPFGVSCPRVAPELPFIIDDVKQPVTCGIYHADVCDDHGWLLFSKRNLSYALPSWLPPVPPVDDDDDEILSNDFEARLRKTRLIEETWRK